MRYGILQGCVGVRALNKLGKYSLNETPLMIFCDPWTLMKHVRLSQRPAVGKRDLYPTRYLLGGAIASILRSRLATPLRVN